MNRIDRRSLFKRDINSFFKCPEIFNYTNRISKRTISKPNKMKKIITLLLIGMTLLLSSCVDKTPLTEEQKVYAGKWVTNDGTWFQIFNNGGANFEQSNSNVTGGSVTFNEHVFEIGLMGLSSKYAVQKKPYKEGGVWKMKLNNSIYIKE